MNIKVHVVALAALVQIGFSPVVLAADSSVSDPSANIENLIEGGTVSASFRWRYETVDDDRFSKDAKASTLRSRLTLQSGKYKNFDFLFEIDDVHVIGQDDYNAGGGNTPSNGAYPVIADPEGTEFNQAFVDFQAIKSLRVRVGRQRINLDNQRFVGGVGWRQNEQTYDSASLFYKADNVTATYARIGRVNRIFGSDVPAGDHDQGGTHLLNLSTDLAGVGKLSGYYYRIDNRNVAAFSTVTYGVRLSGKHSGEADRRIGYTAEFARQSDATNNPTGYSANYWNLEGSLGYSLFNASVGWEVLSGDSAAVGYEAFRTPLATLHAFNGWADVFLRTPNAGLDDKYLKLKASQGPWIVQARYHQFEAEDGSTDYGDELDLRAGYKLNDRIRGDVFFAEFSGKNGFADVRKIWLAISLSL